MRATELSRRYRCGESPRKIIPPAFRAPRYDFRSIGSPRRVDRIDSDVVEVDSSGARGMIGDAARVDDKITEWLLLGNLTRDFRHGISQIWKILPGIYKGNIYPGRARCVSNVRIIFTRVEILMQFFSMNAEIFMRSLGCQKNGSHADKLAHLFRRICKRRCKRKRLL